MRNYIGGGPIPIRPFERSKAAATEAHETHQAIRALPVGEEHVYHTGWLAEDRQKDAEAEGRAQGAIKAEAGGMCILFQRRASEGPGFDYVARRIEIRGRRETMMPVDAPKPRHYAENNKRSRVGA